MFFASKSPPVPFGLSVGRHGIAIPDRRRSRAFSPADLPGLALWLDADDASTLTVTGGVVDEWRDKSGNGRHFAGSGSARPAVVSSAYNGRDAIQFDGVNDALTLGANGIGKNVSGLSVYIIGRWTAAPPGSGNVYFHVSSGLSIGSGRVSLYAGGSANATGGRRLDSDGFQGISGLTADTSYHTFAHVFDYANSDLFQYEDGAIAASTSSFQTAGTSSNTDALGSAVGSISAGTGLFSPFEFSEILVYHAAHDAATRAQVEAYLTR